MTEEKQIMPDMSYMKKLAADSYYMNPDMIKFLLIENLTLKTLLHEKGLITPEEFKECREKAASILEHKAQEQLGAHLKAMMPSHQDVDAASCS